MTEALHVTILELAVCTASVIVAYLLTISVVSWLGWFPKEEDSVR